MRDRKGGSTRRRPGTGRERSPAEGPAALDPTGKRNGRGAYLCRDRGTTCLTQARRRHALVRALRTTSDRIDWDSLAADLDTVPLEVLTSPR